MQMIPGIQQQQQRWPKSQKHQHSYNRDGPKKTSHSKKQSSTTSSVTELPETFGLPSNKKYKVDTKPQDAIDDKQSPSNSADIEIINEEIIDISSKILNR